MTGPWRVSLRLAWRQIWRAKRRSLLVVAMIGGPVLLFAAVSTLYRTAYDHSEAEAALLQLGSADALVTANHGPLPQDPTGHFYESADGHGAAQWSTSEQVAEATGGQVTAYRTGENLVLIPAEHGARAVEAREVDLRRPAASGLATLTDGRLPRTTGEVLVSRALADRGYATGDRLPIEGRGIRTVVGVMRLSGVSPQSELLVGLPGSVLGDADANAAYLVDTGGRPIGWEQVQELNRHGLIVQSRAVILDPPPTAGPTEVSESFLAVAAILLIVVIVLLEVVLLAGPAFAVGTRRQARLLALVVATGATGRQVRRIVLTQAAVLGAGSAIAGAALGVVLLALARPWLEVPLNAMLYPLQVGPVDLLALVVAGTFAAVVAARLPAAQAARQDTVAVLAGRRGEVAGRRGWPIVGLVLAVAGAALVAFGTPRIGGEGLVAAGTIAVVVGAILVTPVVIRAVGRLGGRFPLSMRLASRDAARHTSRTAPAVAAIMATVAGLTTVAIASSSDSAEQRRDYEPRLAMGAMAIKIPSVRPATAVGLTGQVERELPGSRPALAYETGPNVSADDGAGRRDLGVLAWSCRRADVEACLAAGGGQEIRSAAEIYGNVVARPDAIGFWLATPLPAAQRRVLERGGVLVSNPKAIGPDGTVRAVTYREEPQGEGTTLTDTKVVQLPAVALPPATGPVSEYVAETAMTPQTAKRLGLDTAPSRIVVPPPPGGISSGREDRLRQLVLGVSQFSEVYVERGYIDPSTTIFLLLGVVGALIVLVATGTATALALDDARPDFATLAAIGAAPATRRTAAAGQAAITGVLGALFGVAVGTAPGLALTWPLTAPSAGGHVIDMPWLLLGTVVVAVPLVAVLGAAVLTRSKVAMMRRYE
ncbi:FtsX-like permease family protein [Flindersiella endophytica]